MAGKDKLRPVLAGVLTAAFMWLVLYAPTPYVIYEPGIAVPVDEMIGMPGGDERDGGRFLMTTVKMTDANFWRAFRSFWSENMDLYDKKSIMGNYSESEYMDRMSVVMKGSQDSAVEAAYRYAGVAYAARPLQVAVADAPAGSPLQPGDTIASVQGGGTIAGLDDLAASVRSLAAGGKAAFEVERDGERITVSLKVSGSPSASGGEGLPGRIGVNRLIELRSLVPEDSRLAVHVDAGEIGGPSAGLMFALETVDLLTEGDLTGGLTIAGTGTIDAGGEVGAIGGIAHKIVAADRQGALLFLAPAANAEEARRKAESIGSRMIVAGVDSLSEAVSAIEAYRASRRR